jgi:23S rRNA (cytidine2498-2'-O)-methyltransferase
VSGSLTGYLAPEGFEKELIEELGEISERHGRLVLAEGPPRAAAWAQNVWLDPVRKEVRSIKDAARTLRDVQRNWALYSFDHHRRAALIEAELPVVRKRAIEPYSELPQAPLGSWTLVDRNAMIYSARCSSPFAHGEVQFVEDREGPPSRAYLKLWELFTLTRAWPAPGDLCLDLGSSPGGWSFVLAKLGARVISVDKAPLDERVAQMPNVEQRIESAFALDPKDVGRVDWLFSDVICYPERLYALVDRWRSAKAASRFVCTLKFQGETDHETARRFASIDGAKLIHLSHNRHELTFVCAS